MNKENLKNKIENFHFALEQLEEVLDMDKTPVVRDSVIKRFEFTYELGWKAIKIHLENQGAFVSGPKDALNKALEYHIISDGNGWSEMHKMRNLTTHTYNIELAEEVYKFISKAGIKLFKELLVRFREINEK